MPKTTTCPLTQTLTAINAALWKNLGASAITGADGALPSVSNTALITTAGSEGSKIVSLRVASTDGTARILQLWRSASDTAPTLTAAYLLGAINIAANSGVGSGTTAGVDLLAALSTSPITGLHYDQSGKPYLPLAAGQKLFAGTTTAITTLTYLFVTGEQEDF